MTHQLCGSGVETVEKNIVLRRLPSQSLMAYRSKADRNWRWKYVLSSGQQMFRSANSKYSIENVGKMLKVSKKHP